MLARVPIPRSQNRTRGGRIREQFRLQSQVAPSAAQAEAEVLSLPAILGNPSALQKTSHLACRPPLAPIGPKQPEASAAKVSGAFVLGFRVEGLGFRV